MIAAMLLASLLFKSNIAWVIYPLLQKLGQSPRVLRELDPPAVDWSESEPAATPARSGT